MRLSLALLVLLVCAFICTVDGLKYRRCPRGYIRKGKSCYRVALRKFKGATGCPKEWNQHGKSCYRFISTAKTFKEARVDCIKHKGFLAVITSKSENNYLKHIARRHGKSVWVGAVVAYKWIKGGNTIRFRDWQKGQPNGNRQPCVELRKGFGYKWNDSSCRGEKAYICEKYL